MAQLIWFSLMTSKGSIAYKNRANTFSKNLMSWSNIYHELEVTTRLSLKTLPRCKFLAIILPVHYIN